MFLSQEEIRKHSVQAIGTIYFKVNYSQSRLKHQQV